MTAFEKGIAMPVDPPEKRSTHENYQLRGLIWVAVGVGLSVSLFFLLPIIAAPGPSARIYEQQLLKQQGFSSSEIRDAIKEYHAEPNRLRGLAALGIIPIGVGLSYLGFWASNNAPGRHVKIR